MTPHSPDPRATAVAEQLWKKLKKRQLAMSVSITNTQPLIEAIAESISAALADAKREAFLAGYHCLWLTNGYSFDPTMRPGDPEGAFNAWLRAQEHPRG